MGGMTNDQAQELRSRWGDRPCNHPDIIEELETESTANVKWRCTRCGRVVDFDEWRNSRTKAKRNPPSAL
jgi:hypothetical protein